jgi:TonB-linked SusC/RagA family outer membrane protein
MKKLSLLLLCFVLAGVQLLLAQNVAIKGTVTSKDDGSPIPGVSIVVKGTTIGTVSDFEGKYSLNVPQNTISLVFSFVGMKTVEVPIEGRSEINIELESEVIGMNEVVVTAMGINRQARELGYSITEVDSKTLNQSKTVRVTNALSGKVAGLQVNTVNNGVGADTRIVMRGSRSLLGNNQALLVLDGVPTSLGYINTLNPNDIESVSVLKGANAAALYGSDAANGVIQITTKRGEKDRTMVTLSNTTTFENISFMPKLQDRFGSGSGSDIYGYDQYTAFENQCYGDEFDGSMRVIGRPIYDGRIQTIKYSPRPDEKKNFYQTGVTVQNAFSYSGGDEKSSYYLSVQDAKIKGVVPNDEQRRSTVRMNGQRNVGKLRAGYNFTYTHFNTSVVGTDESGWPIYWLVMNNPMHIPITKYTDWRNDPFADVNGFYNDYYGNPYWYLDNSRNDSKSDWMMGNVELEYKVAPWLTALVRSSINYNNSTYKNTFAAMNFSTYGATGGRTYSGAGDKPSRAYDGSGLGQRWTNDFILTAEKTFGDISTRLIGGVTSRESYTKSIDIGANALTIDNFYNISNRVAEKPTTLSEGLERTRFVGAYGDLTIGYKQFLFLHATGRNDWTSVLAAGNNSFFYPGVDLSFVFTDAIPSLKNFMNYGKLRGGITKVGTLNVGAYKLEDVFAIAGGFPFSKGTAFTVGDAKNNPDLQPEMTISKEAGLEVSFLDSRVVLVTNLYQTNTTNQTVPVSISAASGYTSQYINTGEMEGKGFELESKFIPVKMSNGLSVELNVNYAHQSTKVLSVTEDNSVNEISLGGFTNGEGTWAVKGEPYPVLKLIDFQRDPKGRIIVDGTSGYPGTSTTLGLAGQTSPSDILGIGATLRYKGFTLYALAEYRHGAFIYHGIGDNLTFTGIGWLTATNGRQRFVIPNSVINVGTATNPVYEPNTDVVTSKGGVDFWTNIFNNASTPYVTSADFWKLREVSLSYEVPNSVLPQAIKGVSVGFVGRNLLTMLPKSNYYTDPEFNFTTGNATGINTNTQNPPTRSYGFSISVNF